MEFCQYQAHQNPSIQSSNNFRPKTTVMFEGALHQPVFKELKIQNPSNKTISYCVTVVGEDHSSFAVQPSTLNVSRLNDDI